MVDEGNLDHWSKELHPFVLVIYDVKNERAYWLYIQEYVRDNVISPKGDTVTLRVPAKNKVSANAVERFADFSRKLVAAQSSHRKD